MVPAEKNNREEEGLELEAFHVPGLRLTEIRNDDLKSWTKTSNCKFYVSADNKNVEYELANGETDKVCNTFISHPAYTFCVIVCSC